VKNLCSVDISSKAKLLGELCIFTYYVESFIGHGTSFKSPNRAEDAHSFLAEV
jgi:hypothetical protein